GYRRLCRSDFGRSVRIPPIHECIRSHPQDGRAERGTRIFDPRGSFTLHPGECRARSRQDFLMAATRNPELRLIHIRDEIEGLSAALHGVTFEQYRESYTLRRVTERALQIISEAARTLPDELTARHSGTPWHAIVGI